MGRRVQQPRKVCYYADTPALSYTYSGRLSTACVCSDMSLLQPRRCRHYSLPVDAQYPPPIPPRQASPCSRCPGVMGLWCRCVGARMHSVGKLAKPSSCQTLVQSC